MAQRKGRELPDWYLNVPEIPEGAELFFKFYDDLASCRHMDGGIPWTAARTYADHVGLEPDVFDLVWTVIGVLDSVERQWHQNKGEDQG